MELLTWVFGSVLVVSLISLIGILSLSLKEERVRKYLLLLVSFSAGALFGDAFLHLLPEVFEEDISGTTIGIGILSGILIFFVLEKIVQWHHHHGTKHEHAHLHSFGIMNLIGDGVHNFIDGMIIAGSFLVSTPLGIATTLAVILHEIPQEISDFGVLLHAGFSAQKALFFNFLTAITAFLGAGLVLLINNSVPGLEALLVSFTAGGFIYIAGSDLIPELQKETELKKTLIQFVFLVLGMGVMLALLFLE